jgi:hypothetical protein
MLCSEELFFSSFSAENKLGASKATIFRTCLVELSKQFPIFSQVILC